jgi:hypothetical protein
MTVARERRYMDLSRSGLIARSWVATTANDGLVFQTCFVVTALAALHARLIANPSPR